MMSTAASRAHKNNFLLRKAARSPTHLFAATLSLITMATTSSTTASTTCSAPVPQIRVIPNQKLFLTEPNPHWFGNDDNPKNDPTWTNANWLKSKFHFSFAEYNNYQNMGFGSIRVLNDDLVQPHRGFGTHPHANMEIVTYIVEGQLTHQDSMGTKETLGRGSIQFMTAGTGVRHSEFNHGDKPLRFIQTWIKPSRSGLSPNYGSCGGNGAAHPEQRKNKIQHLVSSVHSDNQAPVLINQNVDAYASELEPGETVVHELPTNHQAYLVCLEGSLEINGKTLARHDACEIMGDTSTATKLEIKATSVEATEHGNLAHFLMFTMPLVEGSGRTDF